MSILSESALVHNVVSRSAIVETEALIRRHVRRTPIVRIKGADFGLAVDEIVLKLEFMQHAGSFKARGAFANLLRRAIPDAGVVAASGGNHGAAVAFAANVLEIPATIFVPSVTSPAKVERIRRYGADLMIAGERYADALEASQSFASRRGALPIHAFDQAETMLGQGTLGYEIEQDVPDLETLLVAVGGGGLIGGIAAWFEDRIKIVAVEPEGAPTLWKALAAGRPVDAPTEGIAADSLAPRRVGELMFPFAKRFVEQAVLVTDDDIRNAQAALWETLRVIVEPGGAAAFAALMAGKYVPEPKERLTVLLCGANTTAVSL
jgi:threonine dehydratase